MKPTCLEHHHICKAECCKVLRFTGFTRKPKPHELVTGTVATITKDRKWYFELHGIRVSNNTIQFRAKRTAFNNGRLIVYKTCKLLKGNLCTGHPDNKPDFCKELNWETAHESRFYLTPNCMYKESHS